MENLKAKISTTNENKEFFFFPTPRALNSIRNASINDNVVKMRGLIFKLKGRINSEQDKIELNIKITPTWQLWFTPIILLVFTAGFLFSSHVTINGNNAPTLLSKIGFSQFSVSILIIYLIVVNYLRKDFISRTLNIFE